MAPRNSDDQTAFSAPGPEPGQPAYRHAYRRRGGKDLRFCPRARRSDPDRDPAVGASVATCGMARAGVGRRSVRGLARYLVVRFSPIAAGSGVQRVEEVTRGEAEPATWRVVPVKFVGGVLAIGSGAALGREGPTVQMGAALGTFWARLLLRNAPDQSVINAAGAGAGLAVAFNAPIGASVFVFEELTA